MKFKRYEEWLSESFKEDLKASREKKNEFLRRVHDSLKKNGFQFEIISSPTQLTNGNLAISDVKNPEFIKQILKSWNVYQYEKEPGITEKDLDNLENVELINPISNALIIYGSGNVRFKESSGSGFHFDPDTEEGIEEISRWIKSKFTKTLSLNLIKMIRPTAFKVPKELRGYEIQKGGLELIEATLKDSITVKNYRLNTKADGSELVKTLKSFPEGYFRVISPFLVAFYLFHEFDDNFEMIVSDHGSSYQIYINSSKFIFEFPKCTKVMNPTKDMTSINFYYQVYSHAKYKTYDEFVDNVRNLDQLKSCLKKAKDPKVAKDLESLAHEKRGFITSKKFGF